MSTAPLSITCSPDVVLCTVKLVAFTKNLCFLTLISKITVINAFIFIVYFYVLYLIKYCF